jgi:hypothetical protein
MLDTPMKTKHEPQLKPLLYLGISIFICLAIKFFFEPTTTDLISPYVSHNFHVQAHYQPVETTEIVVFGDPSYYELHATEKDRIIQYIQAVFGDEAYNAIKIAKCESRFNPGTVGDTHIMTYHSGELVGDSIGIFQIRTGGSDFNRARANGLSADEFRTKLKDYKYNIDYAKTIYERRGWSAWYNCMNKVL